MVYGGIELCAQICSLFFHIVLLTPIWKNCMTLKIWSVFQLINDVWFDFHILSGIDTFIQVMTYSVRGLLYFFFVWLDICYCTPAFACWWWIMFFCFRRLCRIHLLDCHAIVFVLFCFLTLQWSRWSSSTKYSLGEVWEHYW